MQPLKADTVTEVTIGPAVAVGDGFVPITSLTIAGADEAEIIKHGATATVGIGGTLAAISGADGYYALDLLTGEVDTEGRLTILINDDDLILPLRHEFVVLNANVFDSLYAASGADLLDVQVAGMDADVLTATAINTAAFTAAKFAAGAIDAAALSTDAVDEIADGVWDELLAGHTTADTAGLLLNEWQDGGRLDLILDTLALEATVGGLNNISTADVLAQVNAALDAAISEISQGVPDATPSLRDAIMLLYMALRNQLDVTTSGADFIEVHNDAGTIITKKALTDSGGDYSEAKMITGA